MTAALTPLAVAAPPRATTARAPAADADDADAPTFAATLDGAVDAAAGPAAPAAPAEPGARRDHERERRDPDALVALLAGVLPVETRARPGAQAIAAAAAATTEDHAAVAGAPHRSIRGGDNEASSLAAAPGTQPHQSPAPDRAPAGRLDPAADGDTAPPAASSPGAGSQVAVPGTAAVTRSRDDSQLAARAAALPPAAAPEQRPPAAPALKPAARTQGPAAEPDVLPDAAVPITTADASRPPVAPVPTPIAPDLAPRRDSATAGDNTAATDAAAATPQASAGATAPAPDAVATKSAAVAPPVGSPAWPAAIAQQLARLGPGTVELQLNPAELGPLKVKVALAGPHAQVAFVSEHLAVRQALEAALPQLRTSFEGNGISLGQATVGSGSGEPSARQQPEQAPQPDRPAPQRPARPDAVAAARTSAAGFNAFA